MADENQSLPLDLGNGLILRPSTPSDTDQLAEFNTRIHHFVPEHESTISEMTRDLMSGKHPGFQPQDFSLIIEKGTQRIVSALALISQVWSYSGIPFKVSRPELVGTDPEFRNRGLIRKLFESFHARSALRGQILQAITGIPYFYRQFGYELGLPYGGGLAGQIAVEYDPTVSVGTSDFQVRLAQEQDLDWMRAIYLPGSARYLITCLRDQDAWRYELTGRSKKNIHSVEISVITKRSGEPVGILICPRKFGNNMEKTVISYELAPGYLWKDITPTVVHWLVQSCRADTARRHVCNRIQLLLGEEHPAYEHALEWLPERVDPGAWYVRVSDLPAFLRLISLVLQDRLANSAWSTFSGPVTISFYISAVRLIFENGQLTHIDLYQPTAWDDADAAFPNLSFLQLLFGFRSLADLKYAYPDCWCRPEVQGFMETVFPKMPSNIWGLA